MELCFVKPKKLWSTEVTIDLLGDLKRHLVSSTFLTSFSAFFRNITTVYTA